MKTKLGSVLMLATLAASGAFAEPGADSQHLQIFPKNLARHHAGAALLVFDEATKTFIATEAAAAWLDDDVATGWPPMPGHHFYLLALAEPQMVSNFCISGRAPSGTVSLFAGDEKSAPGSKSWTSLAKDVPLESINDHRMTRPFNRLAKYLLIETNLTDSGPWYSIYAYGDKPAISYQLQRRIQPVDAHSLLGPYVNPQVDFDLGALYAKSRVIQANAAEGFLSWQKIIDDNPESGLTILPSKESGLVIQFGETRTVQRASVHTDSNTRGKLDFFVLPVVPSAREGADYQKAALLATPGAKPIAEQTPIPPVSLENLTPAATLVFDGNSPRGAINFPPASGAAFAVRWTPDTAGQPITIRELNTFGDFSPSNYEIALTLEAVGDYATDRSKDRSKDGKAVVGEGKKQAPPLIGEAPPKAPFLPGPGLFPNTLPLGVVSAPVSP